MDKQTAAKLITSTFENSFDKNRFVNFSKNLVNHLDVSDNFTYQGNLIYDSFEDDVQSLERIGKYTDDDGKKIDLLIVKLKKSNTLERARTRQRNYIARYLQTSGEKDAALVAFVSPDPEDWRFSLIKMEYELGTTPTGRIKPEIELTPARRYSFLVGRNESSHTAQNQLLPILEKDADVPCLIEFEKAFSVEIVTKEFFTKYRELFWDVEESLEKLAKRDENVKAEFTRNNIDIANFAKKLLGQIVFLYFLQKKGWFGVGRDEKWGTGHKDFLRRLFEKKVVSYNNFFNDILEPLFYNTLALERPDDYSDRFNCKIPFLNGGLFDPINNYDWIHTDILLPNGIFSNVEKTAEGDTGTGILDIFDRYNFTVKEDEPLEKEVAVDPEMLGKVFENLLEVKDRKSKGTYYTPREIVHYMCQESLINYLDTAVNNGEVALAKVKPVNLKLLGAPAVQQQSFKAEGNTNRVPHEDIETLIHMGDFAIEHDTHVENQGKETRDYSYKLPPSIRLNTDVIDEALAKIRVCDPAIGSGAFPVGMMTEIVHARNTLTSYITDKTGRNNYCFKRHAIQNCLYGVDIDPGAVEIAKLRLWLSLVVDEDDIKQIQPLPNLDYKIVCGNSLMGVERRLENWTQFAELERLKPLFFEETNAKKKREYKQQIDQFIMELTENKKIFDFEIYFSEVFHQPRGFDIVIANPPYETSRSEGIDESLKEYLNLNYETAEDKYDYYTFFIEKSTKLAHISGEVCLITPDTYLTKPLSRKIRKYLLHKTEIAGIDDFNKGLVFESVVPTAILLFKNRPNSGSHEIHIKYDISSVIGFFNLKYSEKFSPQNIYNRAPDYLINLCADQWYFEFYDRLSRKPKIIKLGELAEIYNGIQTGSDKTYVSYEQKNAKWQKVITGSDINLYFLRWGGKYVYYVPENLHSNTRKDIFKTPVKIIIRQTADRIIGTYDDNSYFTMASTFVVKQFTELLPYKALLAILNSSLFLYLYRNINNEEGRVLPQIKKMHIFNLPIKIDFPTKPVVDLVDQILAITKNDDYMSNPIKQAEVKELEVEIDKLVYDLYQLTEEEKTVVKNFNTTPKEV